MRTGIRFGCEDGRTAFAKLPKVLIGLHGHKYAIDAMLCATAHAAPGHLTALISDPHDLTALCGGRVTIMKI